MYQVILHVTTGEQLIHHRLLKQVGNILREIPDCRIEVVAHGDATLMLLKGSHVLDEEIVHAYHASVQFLGCENSLRGKNLTADSLLTGVEVVPSALAHVIVRQTEGWAYIKVN